MSDSALVTLAIGQPHLSRWERYCRPAWQAYAQKHGFDLHVITDPLDRSPRGLSRSVAWQKCLVLSQDWAARYRQIVLMDCDIAINHVDAPSIIEQVEPTSVGGVISCSHIPADLRPILRAKRWPYERAGGRYWQADQDSCYQMYGLAPRPEGIIQTGVLVVSPEHHAPIFRSVYDASYAVETTTYEQTPLSHALLTASLFQPIDTRFNSVIQETALVYYPFVLDQQTPTRDALLEVAIRIQLANNFFLHFAHAADWLCFLAQ
jgi:hypothetical protein